MTEPLYAQTCDESAHHLCSVVGCPCCANGHGLNDLGDPVPYRIPVDVDVAADGGAQAMTCDCQEAPCQHETTEPRFTREVPMDFNGYVAVARQAVRILAVFIEPGDILLLDGHISRVTHVNVRDLGTGKHLLNPGMTVPEIVATYASGPRWPVLHITGDCNIIRGPHELVSVIRDNEEGRGLLAPEEIQESVEEAQEQDGDEMSEPVSITSREAAAALVELSRWIDAGNSHRDHEAVLWGRVAKIGEEHGEAIAALIGYTGQDPRKGFTHTNDDLAEELLDVAVTALGALEHLRGHDGRAIAELFDKILRVKLRALGVVR